MDTESFVLSVNTKDNIKDLKNLEDILISVSWMKIMNYSVIKIKSNW